MTLLMTLLLVSALLIGCSTEVLDEPPTIESAPASSTMPRPTTTSTQPTSSTYTHASRAGEARAIADSYISLGSGNVNWLLVDDAITTLINQCLRDSGLSFQQMLPSTKMISDSETEFDPLGIILGDAATYGLAVHLQHQQQSADPGPSEPSIPAGEEELIALALWGGESGPRVRIEEENGIIHHFPTTGCQAEAQEEVYGVTVEEYERTRLALPGISEVIDEVMTDANLRETQDEWAKCMREGGYVDVQSLGDLIDLAFTTFGEYAAQGEGVDSLESWESDLAATDSSCREDTGFGNTVLDAFIALSQQTLSEHEDVLAMARQIGMTALQNAERIRPNG